MITVLRQQLRQDRVVLSIWIASIAVLLAGSAAAVSSEFTGAAARAAVLQLGLATPSLLALRGIPNGDSAGSLLWFQVFAFLAVAVGLMNTFFATRHGRADEEQGRRELLASGAIRRLTPIVSTAVLGLLANLVMGVLSWLGFLAAGYGGAGALVAAAALTSCGLAFLGIGMLASELAGTSRSANSIGVVAVLLAYALRSAGDALGTPDFGRLTLTPAWPSWLSPIAWAQQSFAFTENRLGPALLPLALAAFAGGIAFAVHVRRDLGASMLPVRPGPASAGAWLRSLLGLAVRLERGALVAWVVGAVLLGVLIGSLTKAVQTVVERTPQVAQVLTALAPSGHDTVGLLIGAIMIMIGMMAAAAGIQAVLRVRSDEAEGRAEPLLAGAVSRGRWLGSALAVGLLAVLVVIVLAGAAAFAGLAASGLGAQSWRSLGQALVEIPAALTTVAAAAVLVAIVPRASILLAWLVFAVALVIGLFGPVLNLPAAVVDASPFRHVPAVPFADWGPTVALLLVDAALVALALLLVRRRELTA
jgi:ABC-2 type transport system permease protein